MRRRSGETACTTWCAGRTCSSGLKDLLKSICRVQEEITATSCRVVFDILGYSGIDCNYDP